MTSLYFIFQAIKSDFAQSLEYKARIQIPVGMCRSSWSWCLGNKRIFLWRIIKQLFHLYISTVTELNLIFVAKENEILAFGSLRKVAHMLSILW
jgi:hypothetical protein